MKAAYDRALAQQREREREGLGSREGRKEGERETQLNRWSENTQKTMSSGGERRKDR